MPDLDYVACMVSAWARLGLVPGTRVELLRVAPLGDPVELLVRGASLSIRKAEASAIQVRRDLKGIHEFRTNHEARR